MLTCCDKGVEVPVSIVFYVGGQAAQVAVQLRVLAVAIAAAAGTTVNGVRNTPGIRDAASVVGLCQTLVEGRVRSTVEASGRTNSDLISAAS